MRKTAEKLLLGKLKAQLLEEEKARRAVRQGPKPVGKLGHAASAASAIAAAKGATTTGPKGKGRKGGKSGTQAARNGDSSEAQHEAAAVDDDAGAGTSAPVQNQAAETIGAEPSTSAGLRQIGFEDVGPLTSTGLRAPQVTQSADADTLLAAQLAAEDSDGAAPQLVTATASDRRSRLTQRAANMFAAEHPLLLITPQSHQHGLFEHTTPSRACADWHVLRPACGTFGIYICIRIMRCKLVTGCMCCEGDGSAAGLLGTAGEAEIQARLNRGAEQGKTIEQTLAELEDDVEVEGDDDVATGVAVDGRHHCDALLSSERQC